ncbi:MAG: hypothetical protein Q8M76_18470 [Spirochaetaceae bacterium]|nr:hypothetical protein [Spirochaetaceae bacterium]
MAKTTSRPAWFVMVPAFACACTFALLATSCATSSGATYDASASGESAAARASAKAAEEKKKEEEKERERPRPPAWPTNTEPKPWTPPPERQATTSQRTATVTIEPVFRPAGSGTLELVGLERDAVVYIDGMLRPGGALLALGQGDHELRVSRFGYQGYDSKISILAGKATRIDLAWKPARFYVSELSCSPAAFDPRDPGYLGSAAITIHASAPGTASAAILSPEGETLRELGPVPLTSSRTILRWNGRDAEGRDAPPGKYAIRVDAVGQDGLKETMSAWVQVVAGSFSRSSSLYSGISGAALAPDARVLGPGRFESTATILSHIEPGATAMAGVSTVNIGLRLGLGQPLSPESSGWTGTGQDGGLEIDLSFMEVLWAADSFANSFVATAAAKVGLPQSPGSPLSAAVYAKLNFARFLSSPDGYAPSWDGHTRYSGLSAGLPLEVSVGGVRAFVCPELQISDFYPYWADEGAAWEVPGIFSWGYLRTGVEGSSGPISLALSAAFRTRPFGGPIGLKLPLPVAAELRWHAPDAPLVLQAFATGEVRAPGSYYFGGGLGAGIRY